MLTRLIALAICLGLASAAHASVLRVSAEPPLSAERFGDAIRSYLEGAEVTVQAPPELADPDDDVPMEPGVVVVSLRRHHGTEDDAELVLLDGAETIFARLPGAMRVADLYRTAALKVQALLQRRTAHAPSNPPSEYASDRAAPPPPAVRDRLLLDAGLALMLPSAGPAREGFRLGADVRLARRWQIGLGGYLEPPRSTHVQGIDVSSWELPIWLSFGLAWHQGAWLGRLDALGHAVLRRISAESPGIVANSDTTVSPRAGAALGFGLPLGPDLRADARISLLGVLADTRYRVDGQVVSPATQILMMVELGLAYGLR
jgi:hypothetical protein